MKKLFTLLFIFIIGHLNAQFGFGNLEDINKIEEVPLLVILQSRNGEIEKKLSTTKSKLEKYYNDIDSFNKSIKEGFENSWTFSPTIKFVYSDELQNYNSEENKNKYAYFKLLIDKGDNGFSLLKNEGLITTYNYAIYLTGENKPVYSYMYSSNLPNSADFKFICQQIQQYLIETKLIQTGQKTNKELRSQLKDSAYLLKEKTLLLDKNDISSDLKTKLSSIYKFKYKLTTKEEIDISIMNNDSNIAYLKILPFGQISGSSGALKTSSLMHMQMIFNAEDGKVLAYVAPASVSLGGVVGTALKDSKREMKTKDFEKIIKMIKESLKQLN